MEQATGTWECGRFTVRTKELDRTGDRWELLFEVGHAERYLGAAIATLTRSAEGTAVGRLAPGTLDAGALIRSNFTELARRRLRHLLDDGQASRLTPDRPLSLLTITGTDSLLIDELAGTLSAGS